MTAMRLAGQSARALLLAFAAFAAHAGPAQAQSLTIGLSFEPTSRDPHFHPTTANESLALHVYERLMATDALENVGPGLAESYRIIDANTWEITLRADARFHNGLPVTADDVIFSAARACCVPNQPFSLGTYIHGKTFTRVNDRTVRITTASPVATMLTDLSRFSIVSREGGDRTTADYNAGRGHAGTGPYRVTTYERGQRIVLEANQNWWRGRPHWQGVTIRPITNGSARVAALLAGDVDLIDSVAPQDVARLRASPNLALAQGVSNRLIYLHMDTNRTDTPHVRANDGSALPRNPLLSREVRLALSKAINRQAIVERVMDGIAVPTGQIAAEGMFGHHPGLRPEAFDPDGARALLAQAGYPQGFRMLLHTPNNRLINDERVAQTIAQMFARVGVRTEVEAMPSTTFFARAGRYEFSIFLVGFGTIDLVGGTIKAVLHTENRSAGFGSSNRGRYSNPEVDRLFAESATATDPERRTALLRQATEVAMRDVAIIPLYHQVNVWANRRGIAYQARSDENTIAESARRE